MHLSRWSILTVALVATTGCKGKGGAAGADGGSSGAAANDPVAAGLSSMLQGFEGEIDVVMKGEAGKNGAPQNLSVFVKSEKVRLDIPEGMSDHTKGWVVFDAPTKKLTVVDDAKKTAIVLDLNQKDALKTSPFGRGAKPGATSTPPKVTKTGKKDKVAGYTCEDWEIVNDKNEKATVCVASEGASWFHLPSLGLPTEHAWAAELLDGKHFPLRLVDFAPDGHEKARIEVTKIDKKTLQASQFEVPAGYKVMDLAQMMQGIPGMPSGMPPNFKPPTHK